MTLQRTTIDGFFASPLVPHAVRAGSLLFISGTLGWTDTAGSLPDDFESEARTALENVRAVAAAHGAELSDVVKLTVFLARLGDAPTFNSVYTDYFPQARPARSTVGAALLMGSSIEIDAICVIPEH
jgi:2-iminobutanoate/2-iminopropanoate deaminase